MIFILFVLQFLGILFLCLAANVYLYRQTSTLTWVISALRSTEEEDSQIGTV
jgi:hypothetical protein